MPQPGTLTFIASTKVKKTLQSWESKMQPSRAPRGRRTVFEAKVFPTLYEEFFAVNACAGRNWAVARATL